MNELKVPKRDHDTLVTRVLMAMAYALAAVALFMFADDTESGRQGLMYAVGAVCLIELISVLLKIDRPPEISRRDQRKVEAIGSGLMVAGLVASLACIALVSVWFALPALDSAWNATRLIVGHRSSGGSGGRAAA